MGVKPEIGVVVDDDDDGIDGDAEGLDAGDECVDGEDDIGDGKCDGGDGFWGVGDGIDASICGDGIDIDEMAAAPLFHCFWPITTSNDSLFAGAVSHETEACPLRSQKRHGLRRQCRDRPWVVRHHQHVPRFSPQISIFALLAVMVEASRRSVGRADVDRARVADCPRDGFPRDADRPRDAD